MVNRTRHFSLSLIRPVSYFYIQTNLMKIKLFSTVFILGISTAITGHTAASIDFVNEENTSMTYSTVRCTAQSSTGQNYTLYGQQNNLASIVSLKQLLIGNDGNYKVYCTAQHAQSGKNYIAEFEAVKFTKGDTGSSAPAYDENQKAYGINAAPSGLLSTCYDKDNFVFKQECLNKYYGNKPYYLEQIASLSDVRARYVTYATNTGVFLKINPKYPSRE